VNNNAGGLIETKREKGKEKKEIWGLKWSNLYQIVYHEGIIILYEILWEMGKEYNDREELYKLGKKNLIAKI